MANKWYELHVFYSITGEWIKTSWDTEKEAREAKASISLENEINSWYITEVKVLRGVL